MSFSQGKESHNYSRKQLLYRMHIGSLIILVLSLLTVLAHVQNFVEDGKDDKDAIYADNTLSHKSSLSALRKESQIEIEEGKDVHSV